MKNYKKHIFNLLSAIVILIIFIPVLSRAQTSGGTGGGGTSGGTGGSSSAIPIVISNPFKKDTIQGLIQTIVDEILLPIGGVVAFLMIMWSGFLFITARGDLTKIGKAKQSLLWAVIGAAILLGAWIISQAIGATINQLRS